jgi:hypothetical protein
MSDTGKTSSDHKTATPAEIAWANSVIKRNIVRNVKKKALPTLLRVNQETHMLAVEELYRHLEDCKTVMSHLSRMNNYVSEAVRDTSRLNSRTCSSELSIHSLGTCDIDRPFDESRASMRGATPQSCRSSLCSPTCNHCSQRKAKNVGCARMPGPAKSPH